MLDSEDSTITYTEVSSRFTGPTITKYVPGLEEPEYAPPLPDIIPALTSSPSLLLPSTDHRADRPKVCLAPQKRLCFAFGPRYEVGESSSAPAARPSGGFRVDYRFVATMDMEFMRDLERDVSYGITDTWDEMLSEPFEIDESAKHTTTTSYHSGYARMSIRDEPPTPFWSEAEIARLLVHTIHLHQSSISHGHHHYLIFPHHHYQYHYQYLYHIYLPASPTYPLGYRVAMIQLRAEAPSTSHLLLLPSPIVLPRTRASVAMLRDATPSTYILAPRSEAPPSGTPLLLLPIPLPTPSPPLLPPSTDHRADSERLAYLASEEVGLPYERDVGYGITDTWDEMLVGMPGEPATDETELGQWVIDLVMTVRQDTYEIYGRLDDTQTERQMVTSRVNMLVRYRRAHARTTRLMEIKARMSREAWGRSMDEWTRCTDGYGIAVQVVAKVRDSQSCRQQHRKRRTV
ncbi:hypothetical protein Tco_0099670 [Tanacetum coccineum]